MGLNETFINIEGGRLKRHSVLSEQQLLPLEKGDGWIGLENKRSHTNTQTTGRRLLPLRSWPFKTRSSEVSGDVDVESVGRRTGIGDELVGDVTK